MKVRCTIAGLDCPHCATKLESLLKKEFADAVLNFTLGTLVLDTKDLKDEDEVVAKAQTIANAFEDGITIELRD